MDASQWVMWGVMGYAVFGLFIVMSALDDSQKLAIVVGDLVKIALLMWIADLLVRILGTTT